MQTFRGRLSEQMLEVKAGTLIGTEPRRGRGRSGAVELEEPGMFIDSLAGCWTNTSLEGGGGSLRPPPVGRGGQAPLASWLRG